MQIYELKEVIKKNNLKKEKNQNSKKLENEENEKQKVRGFLMNQKKNKEN